MNKISLVELVHEELGGTKVQAERVVEKIFSTIVEAVSKKEEVSITGFGIFSSKERAARKGRNPATGETIQIKATCVPKFRASKSFKDAVK